MFRCYSYTIIREHINSCLLKLQLLKQSIKIHRCEHTQPHHHCINHTLMHFNSCNFSKGTAVAQCLRCCATNRKIAGSIPDGVIGIFH